MDLPPHPDKEPRKQNGAPVFIKPEELKAGDVLLSYGEGDISWWIRQCDGGWYSHASFFDGTELIEAAKSGVIRTPTSVRVHSQRYLDVYRFASDEGDELGRPPWEPDPVIEAVRTYIDNPFAFHDLILAALLVVTRRVDLPGGSESTLRNLLSRAVRKLRDLIVREEKVHLVCSELVYRGFYEADPTPQYRLQIETAFPRALGRVPWKLTMTEAETDGAPERSEIDQLADEFAGLYVAHKAGQHLRLEMAHLAVAEGARGPLDFDGFDPVADYVTPRDLERSPNLQELGRARKEDFPQA